MIIEEYPDTESAYYADGWIASSTPRIEGTIGGPPAAAPAAALGEWELYNIAKDFSQSTNLAAIYPDKLKELKGRFWKEAATSDILPVVDEVDRSASEWPLTVTQGRSSFHFRPTPQRLFGGVLPSPTNGWHLTAEFAPPADAHANGTIVMGDDFELAIDGGVPRISYKSADRVVRIKGGVVQAARVNRIEVSYGPNSDGKPEIGLRVNGKPVGHVASPQAGQPMSRFAGRSASVGWGFDSIDPESAKPSSFSGTINDVAIILNKCTAQPLWQPGLNLDSPYPIVVLESRKL